MPSWEVLVADKGVEPPGDVPVPLGEVGAAVVEVEVPIVEVDVALK